MGQEISGIQIPRHDECRNKRGTTVHTPASPPYMIAGRKGGEKKACLYSQPPLPSFVDEEARRDHGHDLHVADRQPDPEPAEASLQPDLAGRLEDAQPVAVAYGPADLHPPSDDLEWVRSRLGHQAGNRA